MLKWMLVALLASVFVLSLSSQDNAQTLDGAPFKVGVASRHLLPTEPYNWRGAGMHALLEVIWYPAESDADPKPQRIPPVGPAIFEASPAAPEAKIAASPAKLPLILLSHGTGGTAQTLAWFATALAAHGYIVVGVNHPGNNAMEPYTVQGFTLWWERAKDLSTVLDDILADPDFGPHVDRRRIGGAGFSLGGYTMIELAGGKTSREHYAKVCRATPDQVSCRPPPEFPDLIAKSNALAATDPAYAKALHEDGASYRDSRIRAVFTMAPALSPAFAPASLKTIAIPVAIVAGAQDSIVPVDANAKYDAAQIPHAALTIFPGEVDHYVFVDECTEVGRSSLPLLCVDRPAVDRAAIHDEAIDLAAKFFASHLSAHKLR
jgi:predicted dienelactone hydrolase